MEEERIIKKLTDEGCPSFMISGMVEKIKAMDTELLAFFFHWCDNGKTPDIEIEGFTFESLINDYDMNSVGAFLTLDWLCKEPEKALQEIKRGIK